MDTKRFSPDARGLNAAADVLRGGGLIAFPTETVYGLGADARNDLAVARIFEAKGRPRFNPLIVHVESAAKARELVAWSDAADILAQVFWPGPLTLVLPVRPDARISALVTAELPTLAVRVPAQPVAQKLLAAFDGPVAAPSANISGRISPTTYQHVVDGLEGRIDGIVDGGACDVGLESTIVGLSDTSTLLRPGGVPAEVIERALQCDLARIGDQSAINAPGQLASHYAPNSPIRLNVKEKSGGEVLLGFGPVRADLNLSPAGDLTEAAANLFRYLHRLDAEHDGTIAVSPIPETGLGAAINDRLRRAAAPRP